MKIVFVGDIICRNYTVNSIRAFVEKYETQGGILQRNDLFMNNLNLIQRQSFHMRTGGIHMYLTEILNGSNHAINLNTEESSFLSLLNDRSGS